MFSNKLFNTFLILVLDAMTEIENTNQISVSNPSPSHENAYLSHSNGSSSTNSTEGNSSSRSFSHRLRNSIHSLSSSFGSLKGKVLPKQMVSYLNVFSFMQKFVLQRKKKELKMALKVEHEARLEAEEREKV